MAGGDRAKATGIVLTYTGTGTQLRWPIYGYPWEDNGDIGHRAQHTIAPGIVDDMDGGGPLGSSKP